MMLVFYDYFLDQTAYYRLITIDCWNGYCNFWLVSGCRTVPGVVTQPDVGPSSGEQPWLSTSRHSSLNWSMMTHYVSETLLHYIIDSIPFGGQAKTLVEY